MNDEKTSKFALISQTFEQIPIEIIFLNGQHLFNPYDIGRCLGIGERAIRLHLEEMNDKQVVTITNVMACSDGSITSIRKFNNRGENFLTESGVYKLIFKSRTESAEKFQDFVTDDLLPTLRKEGTYTLPNKETLLTHDKFYQRLRMNRDKTRLDHFSVLQECYFLLVDVFSKVGAAMREFSYKDGKEIRPDVSIGMHFKKYLREKYGKEPRYTYYQHTLPNGKKVRAIQYPIEYRSDFSYFVLNVWLGNQGLRYFLERDKKIYACLPNVFRLLGTSVSDSLKIKLAQLKLEK